MKPLFKVLALVFVVGLIVLIGGAISLNQLRSQARKRIMKADQVRLLAACRDILKDRSEYVADKPTPSWQDEHITIMKGSVQYNEKLPPEIREVKPNAVLIFTNHVALFYYASPIRYVVRAFEEGAKQYGTRQLIDGLCEATNLNEEEL